MTGQGPSRAADELVKTDGTSERGSAATPSLTFTWQKEPRPVFISAEWWHPIAPPANKPRPLRHDIHLGLGMRALPCQARRLCHALCSAGIDSHAAGALWARSQDTRSHDAACSRSSAEMRKQLLATALRSGAPLAPARMHEGRLAKGAMRASGGTRAADIHGRLRSDQP